MKAPIVLTWDDLNCTGTPFIIGGQGFILSRCDVQYAYTLGRSANAPMQVDLKLESCYIVPPKPVVPAKAAEEFGKNYV